MNFSSTMKSLADSVEGSFSQYDDSTAVLIVPIDDHRFQTVYGYDEGDNGIRFISKVCEVDENTPDRQLLSETSDLIFTSFYIENNFLYTKAMTFTGGTDSGLTEMLTELARAADKWEKKLTGADVH